MTHLDGIAQPTDPREWREVTPENRETWQARLWASNDEGLYRSVHNQSADDIRDTFEDTLYGPDSRNASGLIGDVIGLWLARVDWDAVAESVRDEDQDR